MAERFQKVKAIAREFGYELGPTVPEGFSFMEQEVIFQYHPTSDDVEFVGLDFMISLDFVKRGLGWTEQNRQDVADAEQSLSERGFLEIVDDGKKRITERGVSAYHQIQKKSLRDRIRGATFYVAA